MMVHKYASGSSATARICKARLSSDCGLRLALEDLEVAVEKGPHVSALAPDTIDQMQVEAREKEKQGFAKSGRN